ncbi:Bifunctional protein GlmU [Clavibacter michiganensis subsp. michiganensis]|uniref:NTP transferase domain-containing protein n=1 Tax=Clavibacter michiganensis TaxID=28447 RepID=UPI000B699079|nr:NTP transferase domain-containing protein [Clavibacter michiganensis]OUD89165.1 Bifunctional protein GlmU [Clavibacter michiganensis subsp. michiganensis]
MTDSDITPTTREIPIVTGELDVDGEPRSPSIAVVILAAGQGTRMRSRLPKVLHPLAGLPLVGHVLATAEELGARHIVTVVRHDRDQVVEVVRALSPQALVVDQDEIPGTGRAVEVGITALPDGFTGQVVVLSGDVPLLDAATLRSLVSAHRQARNDLTLLTARLDDPTGNGRIIRGQDGAFEAIVEQKDATGEQLRIDEVNAGVYVFDAEALRQTLGAIGTDNAQREKYLTDAADVIRRAGGAIEGLPVRDSWLVAGINDRVQLTAAATELNARIMRRWQLAGVTIQDPRTTWIDVKATLAADVTVLPGTQILGASTVAAGATVGPDTTLRDTEVGEDATASPRSTTWRRAPSDPTASWTITAKETTSSAPRRGSAATTASAVVAGSARMRQRSSTTRVGAPPGRSTTAWGVTTARPADPRAAGEERWEPSLTSSAPSGLGARSGGRRRASGGRTR